MSVARQPIVLDSRCVLAMGQVPPPVNGASLVNRFCFDALAKGGLDVEIFNTSSSTTVEELQTNGPRKLIKAFARVVKLCWAIVRKNHTFYYMSVAHLPPAFYRDFITLSLLRVMRKPRIVHFHGKGAAERARQAAFVRTLYAIAFGGATAIVLSEGLRKDIEGIAKFAAIHVVNNGVPDCALPRGRQSSEQIKFLFFSTLAPSKGIVLYLDALRWLAAQGFAFEAHIAGGDSLKFTRAHLENELARLGLADHVHYHGRIDAGQKAALLSSMDVLVHPTLNDAFPLVILEAFSAGCAVVSTRQGAIPEIISDRKTGLLVEPNAVAVGRAMAYLVENKPVLRDMQKQARETYERRFTMGVFQSRFIEVIANTMKEWTVVSS